MNAEPAQSAEAVAEGVGEAVLIDLAELARLCQVSRRHLARLEASGRLGPKAIKLGCCKRYSRSECLGWIEAGCPDRRRWDALKQFHGVPKR